MNRAGQELLNISTRSKKHRAVLLIGCALVVISALVVAISSRDTLRYFDESSYADLAHSLLHYQDFRSPGRRPTALWPPGYPFAISAAYALVDRPLSAKLMNVIFLGLTTCIATLVVRRVRTEGAVVVPYLVLLYPCLLYTASTLYPQTVGGFILVTIVLLSSVGRMTNGKMLCAGCLYGLLCLTIPAFMLVLPLMLGALTIKSAESFRKTTIAIAVFGAMAILTIAPWTIRNYRVFHAFVPVSTNSGVNLMQGNSALSGLGPRPDTSRLCAAATDATKEVEYDRAYTHCALTWINENPRAAAELYALKLANYFNYRNLLVTREETAEWRDVVMLLTYYPLLLLALVRLSLVARMPLNRTEAVLYVLYFGNAFLSAIFFTRLRFRMPFDWLLLMIDSCFIGTLLLVRRKFVALVLSSDQCLPR